MNYQSKSPPLYVWGIACLLVGIFTVSSFYFTNRSFIRYNKERLHAFSTVSEKRVVAIGTSLLFHGTFFDNRMSDFGKKNGFGRFSYLQITRNGGFFEDFVPLMPAITDAKPNVVVIQSNLLLLSRDKIDRLKRAIARHKKYLKYILSFPLVHFVPSKLTDTQLTTASGDATNQNSVFFASVTKDLRKYEVRDITLPKDFEDFFERAREQKIKIIIIDIPRYEKVEEVITQLPENRQKLSSLIRYLKENYDIEYLEYPEKLGLEYYMDFSHFNQKGRERYSIWLLSCLSKF